jgi:uncharacterized membrane protein required for colicin V production
MNFWADLFVVGVVLTLSVLGGRKGLFHAIILGLTAIASIILALSYCDRLSAWLVVADVPPLFAPVAALLAIFTAAAAGIHFGLNRIIAGRVLRFSPLVDGFGGGLAGALAGFSIAGMALIVWSMLPLPTLMRTNPRGMALDAGEKILTTLTQCLERDPQARLRLLVGEPCGRPSPPRTHSLAPARDRSPANASTPLLGLSSEVFADLNLNFVYDIGEPYLDEDDDQAFSPAVPYDDTNANGTRDIGLLQRYRLGSWDRAFSLAVTEESAATTDQEVDQEVDQDQDENAAQD